MIYRERNAIFNIVIWKSKPVRNVYNEYSRFVVPNPKKESSIS